MEFRLEQQRKIVTEIPGPKSEELLKRRQQYVSSSIGSSLPVYIGEADGAILRDVDGNQFIDFGSGIGVTTVGNANPKVVKAIQDAAAASTHLQINTAPYGSYVDLCQKLTELTPGDFPKKAALFNSGAEAVENAVKIARKYTGRDAVIVFDHAFHGRTNLTMAMTSKSMPYKDGFGPFAPEVYRAPLSYPFRDELSGPEAAARTIDVIDKQVGAKNVAAIIIEPIVGEGGFIVPAEGFLPALVEYANENGIVFVADEVQAGMSRTGKWFCSEWEGIEPDLVTSAKGIAGGMPLSAVVGRAEIMDAPHTGGIGGTYAGNPVANAAALATIASYEEDGLQEAALRIEKTIRGVLEPLVDELDVVGEVRGRGAMLAIELVTGADKTPNPELVKTVVAEAQAQGVVFLTCGTYGNVIRFLPPLVITDELLTDGLNVLVDAIRKNA
ncbi:4-aminobutyrate--2-oxoglutarate transaminase [Gulosibacter molinativorax]|uniref:(S)-3-amino-2-methylpropionate transaminase n=1 Tax=Gulosibacter molinativorax TaxID=256821 RepID=A0ABT7C9M6_9MICO|nr:4-aminobutyrate--2-oxoglutarate transaminase [Gulosibacter molinativorax]MDJ1371919.1 4-aminobutyrate--2-oxoglutarate transaminase [Gulosibacter molinativorax]QUY62568.1 4-aminobutyrate aminotransferase [Gulosibacter molinativorax]